MPHDELCLGVVYIIKECCSMNTNWIQILTLVSSLVIFAGCRTTNVDECNISVYTSLTNRFAMFTTVIECAGRSGWSIVEAREEVVRVSLDRGRHRLVGDVFFRDGTYNFKVVDAINLMYDKESGDIHRNCVVWVQKFMSMAKKISDGEIVRWDLPYTVKSRIVSLQPGRRLEDVIKATFESYGVKISTANSDLLKAEMGEDDERLSLDVRHGPVSYSLLHSRSPVTKTDGSQYNLFLSWIDRDVVRYCDMPEFAAQQRAQQAHADRLQMVSAMWEIAGAIRQGNAINRQGWENLNKNINHGNELKRRELDQLNSALRGY